MCMSNRRMTARRARIEILLIFVRAIRSVFFNLFMLGLGFVLGFGAYVNFHKIVVSKANRKAAAGISCERCAESSGFQTNAVEAAEPEIRPQETSRKPENGK